jgi:sialate O-acetylesterase
LHSKIIADFSRPKHHLPMKTNKTHCICLLSLLLALSPLSASSQQTPKAASDSHPFVSPIFGDNMVLQRGKLNNIWGWSEPGDKITIEIADHTASAVAAPDGRWQAKLLPPAPGGPYILKIHGREKSAELHEILVGDVWLGGGQSNMQLTLDRARNGADEVASANHPEIRFFTVQAHSSYSHTSVPEGTWKIATPQTIGGSGGISAAAYFLARRLQDALHIPIGLVIDCLGGTPAETWTSAATLHTLKDFDVPLAEIESLKSKGGPEYGNYIMHWFDEYDLGLKGNWSDPQLDDSSWKTVHLPGGFDELGLPDTPSVVWFRKDFSLPDPIPAGRVQLFLGSVEKMDTTFINGQWVGASSWVENPRVYTIPANILKPGHNQITIRVFKLKPAGGFLAKPEVLRLAAGDSTAIPLAGEWKAQLSVDARPPHPLPLGFENYPIMPTVLYEGMLAPVAPLSISGVLWYQGEANSERAFQYRKLLPAMISDWRKLFAQPDLPFYIVSLPAFMAHSDAPVDANWAELREAQAMTARTVPHSCLAVAIDTGDPDNIHPKDKKEVGDLLAFCALAEHYGQKIPYSGPTFTSFERVPGGLKLHFAHTDGGLVAKGGTLGEFSVAGSDRKWFWADAKIEGDSIIVSSSSVPDPVAARYAWQSNPAATLFNGAGLPATPFRTDQWPGITESHAPY